MSTTLERRISDVNEAVTGRLDQIEGSLPAIPSKALSAGRATSRRVNDVIASAACSIKGRFDNVAEETSSAAKTTAGQAKAASQRVAKTVTSSVKQSTGQATAQARRVADTVSSEAGGALDDAKIASDPDDLSDLTKAQLHDRATALDIGGRSAMTKAELVGAIQKA